jgi:hypothetical protein
MADAVETKATSWLASTLPVGGDPDGNSTGEDDMTCLYLAAK